MMMPIVVLIFLFCSLACYGEPFPNKTISPQVLAEFRVSERFLNQFILVGKESTPQNFQMSELVKRRGFRGRKEVWSHASGTLYPNISIWAYPKLQQSRHSFHVKVFVGFDGPISVYSQGSLVKHRPVLGSKHMLSFGTTMGARVDQGFVVPLHVSPNHIKAGKVSGGVRIQLGSVSATNSLRVLNRFASRKIAQGASMKAYQKHRQAEAMAKRLATSAVAKLVANSNGQLKKEMRKAKKLVGWVDDGSLGVHFSSKASSGNQWGYLKAELRELEPVNKVSKLPQPGSQSVTSFILHERALVKGLSPMLRGKELSLRELWDVLCQERFGSVISFCKEKLDPMASKTMILFDSTNPVVAKFDQGEVSLTLNAIYRLKRNKNNYVKNTSVLLKNPTSEGIGKEFPYSVTFSYKIYPWGAKRTQLKVTHHPEWLDSKKQELGEGNSKKHLLSNTFRAVSNVFDSLARAPIHKAFDKSLKKEWKYAPTKIPVRFSLNNPSQKNMPVATKHGKLFLLDTKAHEGWLVTSSYFCLEDLNAFGIDHKMASDKNANKYIELTSVQKGSPAELTGFRVGDWISSFRSYGDSPTQENQVSDFDTFRQFIQNNSRHRDRRVVLRGYRWTRNANGSWRSYAFERVVALCPES